MSFSDSERKAVHGVLAFVEQQNEPKNIVEINQLLNSGTSLTSERLVAGLIIRSHPEVSSLFRNLLAGWDHVESPPWDSVEGTKRNSIERRDLVLRILGLDNQSEEVNSFFRVVAVDALIVVAEEHEKWYPKVVCPFYWERNKKYLEDKRKFPYATIHSLDESTKAILERLSDPQRPDTYQSKGLVVGYVQSGKTANFTSLIAKAIDSGYRLIIVLSGRMNLLRNQTQRRLDMELVGKEQIERGLPPGSNHDYSEDNSYEEKFIEYGVEVSVREKGGTEIWRITGAREDYKLIRQGSMSLMEIGLSERNDPFKPINDVVNLERSSVRLIVAKKNSTRLAALVSNLEGVDEGLRSQIPALIIDDESDEASLNTLKPDLKYRKNEKKKRTKINEQITSILGLLPRCQYVGYTATPFANVLVDPDDSEDIFPKDFIVSLPEPPGYMGVSSFHDLPNGGGNNKELTNNQAHVRGIYAPPDSEAEEERLQEAVDMFLLTGAIKLFREEQGEEGGWEHHTMLAHESVKTVDHQKLSEKISDIWEGAGYNGGPGFQRLEKLFYDGVNQEPSLKEVSKDRGKENAFPKRFEELLGHIGEAMSRINKEPVRVVNAEGEAPDFNADKVWQILVGGHKLSRGYTIEGLTISWFRRRSGYQDTVMQMGRWFGFRPGYKDLVRLYIGRNEPYGKKGKTHDIYEEFEDICMDEEHFRAELRRYEKAGGVTPKQVPPLIQNSHPQLKPTNPSKMRNIKIASLNYGGESINPTLVAGDDVDIQNNYRVINKMLAELVSETIEVETLEGRFTASAWVVNHDKFVKMLKQYLWKKEFRETILHHEINFFNGKHHGKDPQIDDWLVIAPKIKGRDGVVDFGDTEVPIIRRGMTDSGRVGVATEPRHVSAARAIQFNNPSEVLSCSDNFIGMFCPRRATALLYSFTHSQNDDETTWPIFTLYPPPNTLPKAPLFTAGRSGKEFT